MSVSDLIAAECKPPTECLGPWGESPSCLDTCRKGHDSVRMLQYSFGKDKCVYYILCLMFHSILIFFLLLHYLGWCAYPRTTPFGSSSSISPESPIISRRSSGVNALSPCQLPEYEQILSQEAVLCAWPRRAQPHIPQSWEHSQSSACAADAQECVPRNGRGVYQAGNPPMVHSHYFKQQRIVAKPGKKKGAQIFHLHEFKSTYSEQIQFPSIGHWLYKPQYYHIVEY